MTASKKSSGVTGAIYFESPAELRAWFERNHDSEPELSIGFYKKKTGRPSLTYQEALDEALCFGWIDNVRHSVDGERYRIRYTPRRRNSAWSEVNIARVKELTARGRMTPAGIAAFEAGTSGTSRGYSYEEKDRPLDAEHRRAFEANNKAWAFFQAQPASYRKAAQWWVMSAKREETRRSRLAQLIECSERGSRPRPFLVSKEERESP